MKVLESLTTTELAYLVSRMGRMPAAADDAERIDRIRLFEEIKAAAAAGQAREAVAFKRSQLEAEESARVPVRDRGKGIAAQVALARRESPHKGSRLLGLAEALVAELPHTLKALELGEISEWRATLVARETASLSREDRARADAALAGRLARLGDRQVAAEARRLAYGLDPHSFVDRLRKAEAERRVTLRPAPDTMTFLTALLPLKQGVAAYAALTRGADTAAAGGDSRSRGQIMADLLVEKVTGAGDAAADVPVEVQLVIADSALSGADETPARLAGYGPVPAPWAREMVRGTRAAVWVRRLYADAGRLVAMESSRRIFPAGLRRFVVARDETCRTPWCGAPIRHLDHVVPVEAGGETTQANGQGLCESCNHAKQAKGWRSRPSPGGAGRTIVITTPTGHQYRTDPPELPHPGDPPASSMMEAHFGRMLERAA